MEMAKLKLSGAAVLLIIVVPMFMYTGALLIGVQLGRALERRPDSAGVSFTIRGALAYLAKELWDANNVLGLGRREGRDDRAAAKVWVPVALSLADESSAAKQHQSKERRSYIPYPRVRNTSATPKAQRYSYHTNDTLVQPMRGVISVGPWGGSGGQPFYMLSGGGSSPPLLRSIMLHHSSSGIFSLACEYTLAGDQAANRIRRAGPWGRSQTTELRHATIKLSAGERVTAVEGTVGHFATVPGVVITSLTFRTNKGRTYGPYGRTTGTPFSTVPAAEDGGCIVGFWGRSGWLLDAIGVYVRPCYY